METAVFYILLHLFGLNIIFLAFHQMTDVVSNVTSDLIVISMLCFFWEEFMMSPLNLVHSMYTDNRLGNFNFRYEISYSIKCPTLEKY